MRIKLFIGAVLFGSMVCMNACRKNSDEKPMSKVYAQKIELESDLIELSIGDAYQLRPKTDPPQAYCSYRSLDATIASVSNRGLIKALCVGNTLVYVKSGGIEKLCRVKIDEQDTTHTFSQLMLPPLAMFAKDVATVEAYEKQMNSEYEPRLSVENTTYGSLTLAFNTTGDSAVKMRMYNFVKPKEQYLVSEINLLAQPLHYVFEQKGTKLRLNRSFRKLMNRSGFVLSDITSLGASYVNPERHLGVIISPHHHPIFGFMVSFKYKVISSK